VTGTPFSRGAARIAAGTAGQEAIELSLRGKKLSRQQEAAAAEEEKAAGSSAASGIRSLLSEISSRSSRIEQLQDARNGVAAGTEQYMQFTTEIATEQQALQSALKSPSIDSIFSILGQVQGAARSGVDPRQLAKALQPQVSPLGSDFIARVGNGDFSSLSLFGGYLSTLQKTAGEGGLDQPGVFDVIRSAVSGALKSLDGPGLAPDALAGVASASEKMTAPLPILEQVSFEAADGLSVSLRGYLGANAVQAAMAHIEYDARDALVLLGNVKEEDEEDKRRKEEKRQRDSDDRLSAGLRPLPEDLKGA